MVISLADSKSSFAHAELAPHAAAIELHRQHDAKFNREGGLVLLPTAPFKRLVYSPILSLTSDIDDVRNFSDAAVRGLSRALKAGSRSPLIVLPQAADVPKKYANYELATMLGIYQALYVPLENREHRNLKKVDAIGFTNLGNAQRQANIFKVAGAIEAGRAVARDIGGSDPERMAAPLVADYVQQLFKDTVIKAEVISDPKVIEREFPCLGKNICFDVSSHKQILLRTQPP